MAEIEKLQKIAYEIAIHLNDHSLTIAETEYVVNYISKNIFQYQASRCSKEVAETLFTVVIPKTFP